MNKGNIVGSRSKNDFAEPKIIQTFLIGRKMFVNKRNSCDSE